MKSDILGLIRDKTGFFFRLFLKKMKEKLEPLYVDGPELIKDLGLFLYDKFPLLMPIAISLIPLCVIGILIWVLS